MTKRGPGRPKSNAISEPSVNILNGEVSADDNPRSTPKRRRDAAGETSPAAKKRVLEGSREEELGGRRRSTRLSRPSPSTSQLRSADAERKQSRDPFEVPSDPPPPQSTSQKPLKPKKVMNRRRNATPLSDVESGAFDAEEGEEGAANPLMTSPASNTRNIHKRVRGIAQARDGENLTVDVQPVKTAQRRQRVLNGTKSKTNVLLNRRTALSRDPEISSVRAHVPLEQKLSAAEPSAEEIGTQIVQPSGSDAPQAAQDRPSLGEEPIESVRGQSDNGEPEEAPQVSAAKGAFDRASRLYGCKKSWDTMLEANNENLAYAGKGNQGSEIQEIDDLIKRAKLAYRAIRHVDGANMEDKDYEIEELLVDIRRSIQTIQPRKNKKKDSRLIKDIYLRGIPKLVQLLKAALVTRSLNGELSIPALKELVDIIDTALKLCVKAQHWRPRPTLEYGVKRRTRNVVKMSLEALRKAYTEAQYEALYQEQEVLKAEKRQALADHVAKFLAQEEERKKRAENSKRERYRASSRRSLNGHRVQARQIDIDELGLQDVSPTRELTGTERNVPWRETGVAAARQSPSLNGPAPSAAPNIPPIVRERTEDIPGPMGLQWSRAEDIALLDGLERFTGANRYLEIDEIFGSPGGLLHGRDVDELMERARFYKESMASHIEAEGGKDRWAWLLSVEG